MPQAAVVPAIGAAASLGSQLLNNRAAGKAADAQEKARQEALAFEREKEQARRNEYQQEMSRRRTARDQAYSAYLDRLNEWNMRHGRGYSVTPAQPQNLGQLAVGQ